MTTVYFTHDNGNVTEHVYSLEPRAALLAMFAQHVMGDYNTWTYEARYGHIAARRGKYGLYIGNCWVKDVRND